MDRSTFYSGSKTVHQAGAATGTLCVTRFCRLWNTLALTIPVSKSANCWDYYVKGKSKKHNGEGGWKY